MRVCVGCGAPLVKRHQLRFCSNACQRAMERREKIERWLKTGEARLSGSRRHYVKLHLMEDQVGLCAICACPATWNDIELTFVLDHIDGDATNNRRENLRLVCPNCDSQLPTYKAKNRGSGRAWRRQRYADGKSY
ncbi:HNH endonuclease [Nocardioides sp. NPDC000445]|uniref:HNH endonuclease n=1 Tax=Nocardioides sp. NPDC000445 TaxID=3154257 RepID=UPI0033280009